MKPTTREEFKEVCLRELGRPAIQIELDDDQIDDRIDEALSYYWDYHFDGTEKIYYKHQITQTDINNKYITIPDNIIGAVHVFPLSSSVIGQSMFDVRYQIALNDVWTWQSTSMIPFYMTFQHIQLIEQLLVGQQQFTYNRHVNRLAIQTNWDRMSVGEYLLIEAYQIVDPDMYPEVWNDRWLKKYAVQLLKRQWGTNLKKYQGMALPGGVQFNGQIIYDEANNEIKMLEEEMINSYSLPAAFMIG